jgi:Spy/CpxP family protein refolding chaperone
MKQALPGYWRKAMTKRKITVGALALAALGFGFSAMAQGPERHGHGPGGPDSGPGFGPPIERMAEQLGLSDPQKDQLEALRAKHQQSGKPLLAAARQARDTFEKALDAENADAAQVGRAALAMKAARDKVEAAHKAAFEEWKAVLTPEQLEKLESARGRGFGPGGRPGHGPRGRGGPDGESGGR